MPTRRACPKCGDNLTKASNYFCNSCGEVLLGSLILPPTVPGKNVAAFESVRNYKGFSTTMRKYFVAVEKVFPFKYFIIIFGVLAVLGGYNLFTTYYEWNLRNNKSAESSCQGGDFSCGMFGSDDIARAIPEDALFYVEGFDFSKLSQFAVAYDPSLIVLFDELNKLDVSHFAIFAENINDTTYWTLLFVSSKNPSSGLMSMLNNSKNIYIGRTDNFYVVSSLGSIMAKVQGAYGGVDKSLFHNTTYSVVTNRYKEGQILLLTPSATGKDIVQGVVNKSNTPVYIKNILNQFISTEGDYLVL